jgi:hypothetical protein
LIDSSKKHLEIIDANQADGKGVKIIQPLEKDNCTFDIIFGDTGPQMRINIDFLKPCEDKTTTCTVIIAFLASLCLVLFTGLALALIILKRKKPITFKFGQKTHNDNSDRFTSD